MATAQLKIPARPPANRILGALSSLTLGTSGVEEKRRKKEEKNLKSKTPSVLPKATSKEAASLTAGRQHNAADTECSI